MLKFIFKSLNNYETGKDDLEARLNQHANKVVILRKSKKIKKFMGEQVWSLSIENWLLMN